MKPSISDAVSQLKPNTSFSIKNGEIVAWDISENKTGEKQPTKKQIQTKLSELLNVYEAENYARKRQEEYPSNGDQWDMIYKDMLNGTTTHKDAVEAVKTKWPKDNSGPVE
jgi:hypothetical protein